MERINITIESGISLAVTIRNNMYDLINRTEEQLEEFSIETEDTLKPSNQCMKLHIEIDGSERLVREVHKLVFHIIISKCDYPAKIEIKIEDAPLLFYGIKTDFLE